MTELPDRLPAPRRCRLRGQAPLVAFDLELQTVTPVLGGSYRTRVVDEIDGVRAPSIRGDLRSWWRALYAPKLGTAAALMAREAELWGSTSASGPRRSLVEVRTELLELPEIDASDVRLYRSKGQPPTPGAYALFPARGTAEQPPAPRRKAGMRFRLEVRCPPSCEAEVRAAVRAWILFGGYGARTRRGLGSLTLASERERTEWLPALQNNAVGSLRRDLERLFGRDILAPVDGWQPCDVPVLAGAVLQVGRPSRPGDAEFAWTTAVQWLQDFRQGSSEPAGQRAREPGPAKDPRPSISNWPEADKVRRLSPGGPWSHRPRHNERPVWPRAGFGLPIIGQFQRRGRKNERYREPENFELRWQRASGAQGPQQFDRLASPLIVKALALADGRFLPCALWLCRAYPEGGQVVLRPGDPRAGRSAAPFDELVARDDEARFQPLAEGQQKPQGERLRHAFFSWLRRHRKTTEIAP